MDKKKKTKKKEPSSAALNRTRMVSIKHDSKVKGIIKRLQKCRRLPAAKDDSLKLSKNSQKKESWQKWKRIMKRRAIIIKASAMQR